MSIMEVCLLVIGVSAFVLSFILPDRKGKNKATEFDTEALKALMEKEMKDAKIKVEEIVDESYQYAIEKMERASERISNEKIMAINEYSDTVLADVNKSHQEVMFLYDMLNDKQKNIKETVKQARIETKEIEEKTKEAKEAKEAVTKAKTEVEKAFVDMPALMPAINDKKNKIEVFSFAEQAPRYEKVQTKTSNEFKPLENVTQAVVLEETVSSIKKEEAKTEFKPEKENNNDKILRLSRTGMSSVDIARELGLGVGEVKLVINLFKGAV